ncbi:hypothetical protein PGIGA_G00021960 [Pangasianodon gigas]|uniref:Uncharacterized protein n=1 Tax=Pangasianodon gigas TaxID=30993 RepID=A0ACC5WWK1_PANGG|nr:hypothetical protein [Pangasianodon gigas]
MRLAGEGDLVKSRHECLSNMVTRLYIYSSLPCHDQERKEKKINMCIEIPGNGHHFTHHLNGFLLTALICKTQQPILKLLLFGSLKKERKG